MDEWRWFGQSGYGVAGEIVRRFLLRLFHWSDIRLIVLVSLSLVAFYSARLFALALRFDFQMPHGYYQGLVMSFFSYTVLVKVFFLALSGQYTGILKYYSIADIKRLGFGLGAYTVFTYVLQQLPGGWVYVNTPRTVLIIDCILSFLFWVGIRTGLRIFRERVGNSRFVSRVHRLERGAAAGGPPCARRVGIMGSGDVGAELLEEIANKPQMGMEVVALFDDNPDKWRSRIYGVKVLGAPNLLLDPQLLERLDLDEIIIAIPSASPKRLAELVELFQKCKLSCRIVPSMAQLAMGDVAVSQLRKVEIEDLLERDSVELDTENIEEIIRGKTVFVTGAGGSIGSELCRQILKYAPGKLVLVEQCEVQMFLIHEELLNSDKEEGWKDGIEPAIADILDRERMEELFAKYRPELIFHAAAHKHVPLMEMQPGEAIKNNTFATSLLADLALKYRVGRFVMISTDKAINPTNVMGATKRMAELYVQSLCARAEVTQFMAVRFGNVLGSSGSVIPTFRRQIEAGGPVTVTHRNITRFFMTIPEAVGLVLQCATQGQGGDIFVLDMGEPVKIADLARNMIRLSGFEPDRDIEVRYTGLRAGEKLFEELSHEGEDIEKTPHPKIMRFISTPQETEELRERFQELRETLNANPASNELKLKIGEIVPEYKPYLSRNASPVRPAK